MSDENHDSRATTDDGLKQHAPSSGIQISEIQNSIHDDSPAGYRRSLLFTMLICRLAKANTVPEHWGRSFSEILVTLEFL